MSIACQVEGDGPPLVMVHGASAGRWGWDLRPPAPRRTASRSGRSTGAAAATPATAPATPTQPSAEFEDVAAVLREAGPGALLFGHSYGGLVAAGAATRVEGLPRVVLYEGPMGGVWVDEAWIARFEAPPGGGRPGARRCARCSRDVGGYTDERDRRDGRHARLGGPPRRLHHRPARVSRRARLPLRRPAAGRLGAPALLLVGSESPDWAHRSTAAYAEAIPDARVSTLEGQGHGAAGERPGAGRGRAARLPVRLGQDAPRRHLLGLARDAPGGELGVEEVRRLAVAEPAL